MFVFGHLGIGNTLARPFRRGLARRWILFGTLLPDLVDKPLYYGISLSSGLVGDELGLISGTRTFGHTALFLAAFVVSAIAMKSRSLAAVSVGVGTHLLLDGVSDAYWTSQGMGPIDSALLWPIFVSHFPVIPWRDPAEHFRSFLNPFSIVTETIGAALLFWETWKVRHRLQILSFFRERRFSLRLRKRRKKATSRL